jgi:hypothetical protein
MHHNSHQPPMARIIVLVGNSSGRIMLVGPEGYATYAERSIDKAVRCRVNRHTRQKLIVW